LQPWQAVVWGGITANLQVPLAMQAQFMATEEKCPMCGASYVWQGGAAQKMRQFEIAK
jgi:hypothetical protein